MPDTTKKDRYELFVVYPDGNPQVIERHSTVRGAVEARDRHMNERPAHTRACYFVNDSDDPERGSLGWDEVYAAEHAATVALMNVPKVTPAALLVEKLMQQNENPHYAVGYMQTLIDAGLTHGAEFMAKLVEGKLEGKWDR